MLGVDVRNAEGITKFCARSGVEAEELQRWGQSARHRGVAGQIGSTVRELYGKKITLYAPVEPKWRSIDGTAPHSQLDTSRRYNRIPRRDASERDKRTALDCVMRVLLDLDVWRCQGGQMYLLEMRKLSESVRFVREMMLFPVGILTQGHLVEIRDCIAQALLDGQWTSLTETGRWELTDTMMACIEDLPLFGWTFTSGFKCGATRIAPKKSKWVGLEEVRKQNVVSLQAKEIQSGSSLQHLLAEKLGGRAFGEDKLGRVVHECDRGQPYHICTGRHVVHNIVLDRLPPVLVVQVTEDASSMLDLLDAEDRRFVHPFQLTYETADKTNDIWYEPVAAVYYELGTDTNVKTYSCRTNSWFGSKPCLVHYNPCESTLVRVPDWWAGQMRPDRYLATIMFAQSEGGGTAAFERQQALHKTCDEARRRHGTDTIADGRNLSAVDGNPIRVDDSRMLDYTNYGAVHGTSKKEKQRAGREERDRKRRKISFAPEPQVRYYASNFDGPGGDGAPDRSIRPSFGDLLKRIRSEVAVEAESDGD